MSFTLDTNILIGLVRKYPRDIFGSLWDSLESEISAGGVCICEAVVTEVQRGGDELLDWAKSQPSFVCSTTDAEFAIVADIAKSHPDWVRGQMNEADPFVIAHAELKGSVIVTEENVKGANTPDDKLKLPNIAAEHGVTCIKFFEYVRGRAWRF